MKKLILVFSIFTGLFCYVNAEEKNDLYETEDSPIQLLEITEIESKEQDDFDSLEILQENNEEYVKKNEEIIMEEKKRVTKIRKENIDFISWTFLGADFPVTYTKGTFSDGVFNPVPFGIFCGALSSMHFLSFKFNLNYDFNISEAINKTGSYFVSFGISPVYNRDFFFGCYFSLGWETVDKYSFTNIGASATMMVNLIKMLRIYINVDVTYRYPDSHKEIPVALECLANTWRISLAVGVAFIFF